MPERTIRQRIADALRDSPATASDLAAEFAIPTPQVYDHVEHVARSAEEGELLVAPPECRDCGFDGFDDPVNAPSRCPECRNENLSEPVFTIEEE